MTTNEYIYLTIDEYGTKYSINISSMIRDNIYKEVLNGVYAFNIIYDISTFGFEAILFKPLDYKLLRSNVREGCDNIIHKSIIGKVGKLQFTYTNDGIYRYSESETLIFDPSIIRNLKLEKILNEKL